MRRLQVKQPVYKGEITIFLSLIFILLLSLIGSLVQSASIHITKSMKRADTELALESVFAEYESKVLEEYDIFVKLDGDEQKLSRRLWFYGAKNMEHEIQKIKLLTDSNGQAFYEQAVRALGGEVPVVESLEKIPWEEKAQQTNRDLDTLLQEEGQSLPAENNPLSTIKQVQESDFLSVIISNPENLSNRYILLEELPSHRTLRKGSEHFFDASKDGATQKLMFTEYLTRHFPSYTETQKNNSLFYEAEYLLEGKDSDMENLETVLKKILSIRTGINYAYLITDQTKQAEAETMAIGLCSLLSVPGVTEVVKQAILFAWAYGEGIQDLRILTQGKKVPLVKTKENWKLSLDGLLKLGTAEHTEAESASEQGMSYGDYLKAFLLAEDTDNLCMRALDLIELKMGIRVDGCVTAIQMKSTCEMQRGIQDIFLTEYHYQ